jgi:glycosyltransferase involved in cell wall biosynthesis
MFTNKTSLIIPTRNRPHFIKRLLNQLLLLNLTFQEILIVDSSDQKNSYLVKNICKKYKSKYFHTKPSISYQRNFGLNKKKNNIFFMFLDDDIIFYKDSFKKMNEFIFKHRSNDDICAFGFNMINQQNYNILDYFKKNKLAEFLNIYSKFPGRVMQSGWHTKIENLKKDYIVEWIYSAATVYKSKQVGNTRFSDLLGVYSYLEDLDFSLSLIKKNMKLTVAHQAKFKHPNTIERNCYEFGVLEITNRYNIVKKYQLNIFYFYFGTFLKFLISFSGIFKGNINNLKRSFGNITAIFKCLLF